MTPVRAAAIVAAGGRGLRLGGDVPKQLRPLGGSTLAEMSARALDASGRIVETVVVLPEGLSPELTPREGWLADLGRPVTRVTGGPRRQDSVARGLEALRTDAEIVVVHDAARPFVSREVIERTIDAAAEHGAAIAAVPVHDTVKLARREGDHVVVERTVARERVFLAQTPQAFRRDVLADAVALGQSGVEATDEAALAELAGYRVVLVEGDRRNRKITTPEDWELARTMVASESAATLRIGVGYDLHRFVAGRRLVLGGVEIPFEKGLLGHSDADAVCHAVTDAVLGAAGEGDIGAWFPDTDPQWKDADSATLLAHAMRRIADAGFAVVNLDVVVIAELPKIGPHRAAIRSRLAALLGVAPELVSVKGKTNEGVGEIGRGEAIAVHAVVLLRRTG